MVCGAVDVVAMVVVVVAVVVVLGVINNWGWHTLYCCCIEWG